MSDSASIDELKGAGLLYLATPYTKYQGGIDKAFRDAARLAGALFDAGVRFVSPIVHGHPMTKYGDVEALNHDTWLAFDRALMDRCDGLLVAKMEGWQDSYGVAHEMEVFRESGRPIFFCDPPAPPPPISAASILNEGARLVAGDRQGTHGDMLQNHGAIAALWSGYLKARRIAGKPDDLSADEAAIMLGLMKGARTLTGSFNVDDSVDGAAYFAIAAECRARGE